MDRHCTFANMKKVFRMDFRWQIEIWRLMKCLRNLRETLTVFGSAFDWDISSLFKKKHLPSTLKTSLVMGISSSAMPNNSKSGVGCTASCNAITVKASIKLSKPPIGWAAEHGALILVSEVRDWCFMGWANWSGNFWWIQKWNKVKSYSWRWTCFSSVGNVPSLMARFRHWNSWIETTPGFIWIDPILTVSSIHYIILGTILKSWTWIHCMLREFPYLTTSNRMFQWALWSHWNFLKFA